MEPKKKRAVSRPPVKASRAAGAALPATGPAARGASLLTGAVGPEGPNAPYDVKSVQHLLNLNGERIDLPEPLACDGVMGDKTAGAIRAFQKALPAAAHVEGAVRPGDATLLALCAALPEGVSEELLLLVYLNAAQAAVKALTPPIVAAMERYGIDTPLRQSHFLAQIGHESLELRFREELASGDAYENRQTLGNCMPGDGPRYKGRGLIQLTGRANYADYAGRCGRDVLADPGLVASSDALCADVAGWFWERRGLNALADRDDLKAITRWINGGLNGLSDRRRLLARARTLVGA